MTNYMNYDYLIKNPKNWKKNMDTETKYSFKIYYVIDDLNEEAPLIDFKTSSNQREIKHLTRCPHKKNLYSVERISSSSLIEFILVQNIDCHKNADYGKSYTLELPGDYLIYQNQLISIFSNKDDKKIIFFADLDGTLLGDWKALQEFNSFWLKHCYFDANKLLIYNTGRCWKEMLPLFAEGVLYPDLIITSIGSQVFYFDEKSSSYILDQEWNKIIYEHWDPKTIIEEFEKLKYLHRFECNEDDDPGICYLGNKEEIKDKNDEILELKSMLENKYHLKIQMLLSFQGERLFLDLLSESAGKGKVIEYLCKKLDFSLDAAFAFGDSMNDIGMLLTCKNSVIVANSQDDLLEWYQQKGKNSENNNIIISETNNAWALLKVLEKLF